MESGSNTHRNVRKWVIAAGLVLIALLLVNPVSHAVFAVRLALSLQKLAAGADNRVDGIREVQVQQRMNGVDLDALLYYPEKSPPRSAIILVAGLSELGYRHPRLIALSRLLAEKGLLVVTPDIREFRAFKISAEPIRQIVFWHSQIPKVEGGAQVNNIGLAGISFSGTLAMMAAARPEIRDKVGFLVAIGPYSSLIRCTRGWFAASPVTVREPYYPTRFYAKWIVMLAALDMLESENDRRVLRGVLHSLLLQKPIPSMPADLTADGTRWYTLATMRENQSDAELSHNIEQYLVANIYPQLDPENAVRNLQCPAFLIHGAYDDLIPAEESVELSRRVRRSHLLISPFLTHTHPTDKTLTFAQKAKAAADTIVFSYHLSRSLFR